MLFNVYCVSNQCDTHVAMQIEAESMEEAFEELVSSFDEEDEVDDKNLSVTTRNDQGDFWRYEL